MKPSIMFALALTASQVEVGEVIDAIRKQFGMAIGDNSVAGNAGRIEVAEAVVESERSGLIDSAGTPWDERIHSKPPTEKADGTWRARRGVDAATVAAVTATLNATVAPNAAPLNGLPSLAPMPTLAPIVADTPYSNFIKFIVSNTNSPTNPAGKLTDDYVSAGLKGFGIADGSLQSLAHRLDLLPTIEAAFRQALGQ